MSTDRYPVKPHIREGAHLSSVQEYERLHRRSLEEPEAFWAEQAGILDWYHPWHRVFDADYDAVDFSWYSGGRLNVAHNCVDRHVAAGLGERTALIWVADEPGTYRILCLEYCGVGHHRMVAQLEVVP